MKQCMLCNQPAIDDAETCPNDGEASWGPAVGDPRPAELSTPDDAAPVPSRKRGSK